MARTVSRIRNMTIAKQAGELARLRVLGGPDHGTVFVMTANRATIGRGEENDIILSDLKASRKHIEVMVTADGSALVRDLGSSNGFAVNGTAQKQTSVRSGDKIGLGQTVLEYIGLDAGATQFTNTLPVRTVSAIGSGISSGLTQFLQRPTSDPAQKSHGVGGSADSFFERNRKFLTVLGALMAIATLLPSVEEKQRAKKNKYVEPNEIEAERSISSIAPPQITEDARKKSDIYFKEGFREYRAHNWLRAIASFETAKQIYPEHTLARIYLESTQKEMEDEAKETMTAAKNDEEANRLHEAYLEYDSVRRLYFKDQSNALYKDADSHIEDLKKKIKDSETQ
jgi:pSer/pThr/pTyr-binding forkhead associated (FHA) protein